MGIFLLSKTLQTNCRYFIFNYYSIFRSYFKDIFATRPNKLYNIFTFLNPKPGYNIFWLTTQARFMTIPGLGRKATPKKYLLVAISIFIKKLT